MTTPTRTYVPATSLIDPAAPGGVEAMIAFHRPTFGTAVMEDTDEPDSHGDGDGGLVLNAHGFPDRTPWKDMEPAHQAAYWPHQARRHEDRAKATKDYDTIKAECGKDASNVEGCVCPGGKASGGLWCSGRTRDSDATQGDLCDHRVREYAP